VRSVPAQDLFLLVAELGLSDCTDLVALASPEQFQSFIDLDSWDGDRFIHSSLVGWLEALPAGGCKDIPEVLGGLDPELQGLLMSQLIHIQDIDPDVGPPDPIGHFVMDTPDWTHRVSCVAPEAEAVVRLVLGVHMARGPEQVSRFLERLRHELPAQMEESSLNFRGGRMEDLGFPPADEAWGVEVPYPSVEHARRQGSLPTLLTVETDLPRYILTRHMGELLRPALEAIEHEERSRVAQDLVYLVNAVMVGSRVALGNLEAVQDATRRVHAHISLATRWLGGSSVEEAADILRRTPARVLYRTCVTLLERLAHRARSLEPLVGRVGAAAQPILQALSARPPRREDGGWFSDPAELVPVEALLDRLEWAAEWLAEAPNTVAALDLFGTRLVRRGLGLEASWAPIRIGDFRRFLAGAIRDEALDEATRLAAELEAESEAGRAQVRLWCAVLSDEWGSLSPDDVDPRYLAGIQVDTGAEDA